MQPALRKLGAAGFDVALGLLSAPLAADAQAKREQLVSLTLRHRLPSIFAERRFVPVGGLMAYTASIPANFRRAAAYVDKILKGANPGELPVEQPAKFDFAINLKPAKALGPKIPSSLVLQATEVVQ